MLLSRLHLLRHGYLSLTMTWRVFILPCQLRAACATILPLKNDGRDRIFLMSSLVYRNTQGIRQTQCGLHADYQSGKGYAHGCPTSQQQDHCSRDQPHPRGPKVHHVNPYRWIGSSTSVYVLGTTTTSIEMFKTSLWCSRRACVRDKFH